MPKSSMLMLIPIRLMVLSRATACSTSSMSRPSVISISNLLGSTPHCSIEFADTLAELFVSLNWTVLMLTEIAMS